jgi:glycogen debranching enzyme
LPPPLEEEEWINKTGSDPKNWPWSYHNGGHWPSLLWYLAGAIQLHAHQHPSAEPGLIDQLRQMLEDSYQLHLKQLPVQRWAEYFDGPTGTWVGQQARNYQTWTIVGLLLTHKLLRGNQEDLITISID